MLGYWLRSSAAGNVDQSVEYFYVMVNNLIRSNVSYLKASPSHYSWYSVEFKQSIDEKKAFKWFIKTLKDCTLPGKLVTTCSLVRFELPVLDFLYFYTPNTFQKRNLES